jgi:hypothetical protein
MLTLGESVTNNKGIKIGDEVRRNRSSTIDEIMTSVH